MRRPRLSGRLRLERIPAKRHGLRHCDCRSACAKASGCPSRSSRRRPRRRQGTTSTSRSSRWPESRRIGGRRAARAKLAHLPSRRRIRAEQGHPDRRHEVRVGPDGRRAIDPDRRSAYARQLALLARRRVRTRAAASRRSTSSSSATGWKTPPGTRTAGPLPCPTTWSDRTREKYIEAYERLTGQAFAWK